MGVSELASERGHLTRIMTEVAIKNSKNEETVCYLRYIFFPFFSLSLSFFITTLKQIIRLGLTEPSFLTLATILCNNA